MQMSKTLSPEEHDSYDRSARRMDVAETWLEAVTFIGPLRRRAWEAARGRLILEIGVGSGRGFPFHPHEARVVAFDFSPKMLRRAVSRAAKMGLSADLLLADVNYLPFKTGTFDTALATFVFCMPPDPVASLSEVARACRPEGQIVLMEHVRPRNWLLGKVADLLEKMTARGGEHVNRETARCLRETGAEIVHEERHRMGIVELMQARPAATRAAIADGVDNVVAS
jgi:phosphatidylethanolamine/phosphatidyl-N-methylethanolamine N-methyltransferase